MDANFHQHFSRTYQQARDHFLALCVEQSASLEHIKHPEQGPEGDIFMDVALWGELPCDQLLVITSATHGIEGYYGSGLQSMLLADGLVQRLPEGVSLLMVHAVNPHGFAWQRRVNESNIDLNRNFINHEQPPANDAYGELAELLEPVEWNDEVEIKVGEELRNLAREKGARWLQAAMTQGQYEYNNGFFYGGKAASWSNLTMHDLGKRYLSQAKTVTLIDIHTALGEFGAAECITSYAPDSDQLVRARARWGDRVKSTQMGESLSVDVTGPMVMAMESYSDMISMGLEFGTVPSGEVSMALIADQWLHRHGDLDMAEGHPIKDRMMAAFYPDSDEWRESISAITAEIIQQYLDDL